VAASRIACLLPYCAQKLPKFIVSCRNTLFPLLTQNDLEDALKALLGFRFCQNTSSDGADVMSSVRVFQSLGRATASDRSPTVTSRDGGMTNSEEVDDRWDVSNAAQWIRVRQIPRCSVVKTMTASQVLVNSDNWHAACLSLSCTPFPYST